MFVHVCVFVVLVTASYEGLARRTGCVMVMFQCFLALHVTASHEGRVRGQGCVMVKLNCFCGCFTSSRIRNGEIPHLPSQPTKTRILGQSIVYGSFLSVEHALFTASLLLLRKRCAAKRLVTTPHWIASDAYGQKERRLHMRSSENT